MRELGSELGCPDAADDDTWGRKTIEFALEEDLEQGKAKQV